MNKDDQPSALLAQAIDPEHLLRALQNSLEHEGETAHGVTGLHFENYSIVVRRKKAYSWLVECKFKRMDRDRPR